MLTYILPCFCYSRANIFGIVKIYTNKQAISLLLFICKYFTMFLLLKDSISSCNEESREQFRVYSTIISILP